MKNSLKYAMVVLAALPIFLSSCGSSGNGQLIGVQNRIAWYQPDPYGMLYLPMGSYNMGPSDQDVPYASTAKSKTVSVQAFYMDETEITNNEYRQFVFWVRDSIARRILGEEIDEEEYLFTINSYDEDIDPPHINWNSRIDWADPDQREALEVMYYPEFERFRGRREIDSRKLKYEYFWIDYREAARKGGPGAPLRQRGMTDRSIFIKRSVIDVYPDTLCWVHDFTYSFNEPMTKMYFSHPAYDDYPVVGVTWLQARAFGIWRTELLNGFLREIGGGVVQDFRLPTESEWEYAARGGLDLDPYPWGGPYIRNTRGCFLANLDMTEVDKKAKAECAGEGPNNLDGGIFTVPVGSYLANDFGLFNMTGNVSEMIQSEGITKGGSWNTKAGIATLDAKESILTPSPEVGFRVIMIVK